MKKKITSKRQIFLIILVLLLLAIGGIYFYHPKRTGQHPAVSKKTSVLQLTPPPLTNRQKQQLADQNITSIKTKTFDITGGNFFFSPDKITVNQGDKITIIFINSSGVHDFIINSFHIQTPIIKQGEFLVEKFAADKKGTYTFYSDLPQDQQHGMKGTLIVR